jgi:hypothetical protein
MNDMENKIPCCPPLETDKACDVLDFHYRLRHNAVVGAGDRRQNVPVEVIIHVRIERCPGPMALGDLVYTTTLLPGEKVRLFTTDRRSRFTFDSATKVSYRNEQTSEEHFYMSSMSDFMSDVTVKDFSRATNTSRGSTQGHAETGGFFETIFGGPSVDVGGSYNASSTSEFLRELSQHSRSSHRRSEMGARASSTVSVGEVQTRTHVESESQDHFESSSREFANPNRCHAITFFFYRINKLQKIRITLESIERRVIDPTDNTKVTNNPFVSRGDVGTIPNNVLATDKARLEVEDIGRRSVLARKQAEFPAGSRLQPSIALLDFDFAAAAIVQPFPAAIRQQALDQVDKELVAVGLLDKPGGVISDETKRKFSVEIQSSLPTPGVIVKGCLDDCDVCEPALQKQIELELERKALENELLKKKIELLEKSQEYRCCPAGEEEEEE